MKKQYALFIVASLAFAACSKSNDPAPDASTVVAGTYQLTYLREDSASVVDSINLPYKINGTTVASGTIIATRIASATLTDSISFTFLVNGTPSDYPLGRVTVQTNGTSYDLYDGADKIGTADGTNISIDTDPQDTQTYRIVLKGKK
ncbi:hypothetical protein [Spirosoma flavum]|uniref:Lipocalin-like domain-containing protein n=1 Tax=Spirosoma flavum TaxID=2048557 RepID=A0ABW6ARY3_9BACT